MHPTITALATGNLTTLTEPFVKAGMTASTPAPGILQLIHSPAQSSRPRLLLSVAIHGDETAPLEMLAHLLDELITAPHRLVLDLMIVVGNPAAIAAEERYIDADLNRMFRSERGDLQTTREAERADDIMSATTAFFDIPKAEKWHLDLHTAIRESYYPTFAVVPEVIDKNGRQALLAWLGKAGIEAAILNPSSAGTYSAYTAERYGAVSATVELGQVGTLGKNDLTRFADTSAALSDFIYTGVPPAGSAPAVFRVTQELIKHSEAFCLSFDRSTKNFTALPPGSLIAQDRQIEYRVGPETEYVVFPNPDVRPGLRAGLMVVREKS
ncbi:succinylglutamate desuccinylase [Noviherbaspirillum saxi]|uniref:Succinylglutamate desuccinylase n=1 Tax=Noviherbaspirillum saxi TaxID=2320863 RepID=A0A3A3FTV0_9BURK|nr:succinylglutamate desuccinylase [Noviherbaspirillum saxi]RJF98960.1 succinylglutamate desuccinylase [Noviherbaspirillum saxi]